MQNYEKLGAFYLGRKFDPANGVLANEPLLYDAKDLTTHAVCVGMTGSGKTGLCVSLLEEAAIDGIPAIIVDPKGDLANLLLTFPDLRGRDFRPWIDEAEAARRGQTPDEYAASTALLWKKGLKEWGQSPDRIALFKNAADVAVYTPGGNAGLPLTVLKSFAAPPDAVLDDGEAFRERVKSATAGLLTLLGIEPDPIRSREHILLSNIFSHVWNEGRDLDLPALIHAIQDPPFERMGVLDLESFYPANDRFALAMLINNLLASPEFAAWTEGEELDVGRLLWTPEGRPRLSVLSIAHLSDTERMFFVTLLLNEVIAWMRSQPGTASLRALLYMDEVFGYFPPTANPPSKTPMLTLLKQARAFGLGVVLATQNPVDLDYKGLSNCGTWFLGRLQTERDKARVMDGLEGASAAAGAAFDRGKMEATLAGLQSRVFLMNNVHEDEPVLFHTRWVLLDLAGPMTRGHIRRLTAERNVDPATAAAPPAVRSATPAPAPAVIVAPASARPVVPEAIDERFVAVRRPQAGLLYRPALLGTARLHYVKSTLGVDDWRTLTLLAPLDEETVDAPWERAEVKGEPGLDLEDKPEVDVGFEPLPVPASQPRRYTRWKRDLVNHLYRTETLDFWRSRKPKLVSRPGETEGDFRSRLTLQAREARDLDVEKLRKRFGPKLVRIRDRIRRSQERVEREQAQYKEQKISTVLSFGSTLLGALFGRKVASRGNISSMATSVRRAGRTARERGDIGRAREELKSQEQKLRDLEAEFEQEVAALEERLDPRDLEAEHLPLSPRKSDIDVSRLCLVWMPWRVLTDGAIEPAFADPARRSSLA